MLPQLPEDNELKANPGIWYDSFRYNIFITCQNNINGTGLFTSLNCPFVLEICTHKYVYMLAYMCIAYMQLYMQSYMQTVTYHLSMCAVNVWGPSQYENIV